MTRILIVGHTGFVGRRLTSLLENRGETNWLGASRSTGVDLTTPDALDAFQQADVIVNLAGRVGAGDSWARPAEYFRANLLSTLNVMEHARRTGARVIQVSSYVYGIPQYQPIDEIHPVSGLNPYADSKLGSEAICKQYADAFSIPVTILRPFNLFGPGQIGTFLVPLVIAQALGGGPVRVHSLTPRRDYLWVDDLADAIARVVERPFVGYSLFNLGSGESYSTQEVIDAVFAITGPCAVHCEDTPRVNELSECICDSSRFREMYGWKPEVSMEHGIARLVKEFRGA
jgi:nucleoside-diphosphate-sugar epimerase